MDTLLEIWLYPCKMHLHCLGHTHVVILLEIAFKILTWTIDKNTSEVPL